MESMTCLERYIWAWKNARWKNMPFIITRIAFLKTLFQSSSSAQTDGEKASTQTRGNQSFNAKHESNIWGQVGPENGLQLAHSTPIVSAGASCPVPQGMCCCLYFCHDAWGRILFISCWWNSLFFFFVTGEFPLTYFAIAFPFRWGQKKDVSLSLPHPYHKRTCCWSPPEIIWCHSQSMHSQFPWVQE